MFAADGRHYIHRGQVPRPQLPGVKPDPHLTFAHSTELNVADAGDRLQLFLDNLVGVMGQLPIIPAARHRDPNDGLGGDIDLVDDRLVHISRKVSFGEVDLGADLRRRNIDILVKLEFDPNQGHPFEAL